MSKIGVSTACFYPMYTEKALEEVSTLGVSVCEIFLNCFSELEKPFLEKLRGILRAGNLSVTSIHPFLSAMEGYLFFSSYDRRTDDGIEIYKKMFYAAQYLGAEYFVLHGAHGLVCNNVEEYAESYRRIARAANEFGITLTHENVCRTVSNSVDFIRKFKKSLNNDVSFTFDIKQCIRAGQNPLEMIDAMGDCIQNVHINDYDLEKKECRLPLCGNCDISGIIEKLKSYGYNGNYIIEVYNDNYSSKDEISVSAQRLESFINC
ncbi:MAG: sugar phosphate isomerase/epimerase [Clostridia bacterium]|nr:sugar phosphate isomerase/epimerase [Clostridia bacterium]